MAVLGRVLLSSAERLDLADVLSIDSYSSGDWSYFIKSLVGPNTPYILKGFDIIDPANAIGTQACSINIADSVVYYPSSDAGSFYYGLDPGNPNAVPLVPDLRKNATNYIYLTFSVFNTSEDARSFWDPDENGGVGGEFTQEVNTESVLQVDINVSTGSFPTGTVPVAIVTVGPVTITSIEDARPMMFRLGTGGISADPFATYGFRNLPSSAYARTETPILMTSSSSPNAFQGGDKNIYTLKEWMDMVMTKLLELGGTTYWYEDTGTYSLLSIFTDTLATTFKSKGQWQHSSATPGLITWTEDLIIKSINSLKDTVIRSGNVTLANEQVAFLSLVRNQPTNVVDMPVAWSNGQNYVNTVGGVIGLFGNLAKGDWIRQAGDETGLSLRVEEFYDTPSLAGSISTPALAKSIRLSGIYQGATGVSKGRYDKGTYLSTDVQVANRDSAAITAAAGNMHWLAMRSDTIEGVSSVSSITLSGTITSANGTVVEVNSPAHAMSSGDRITVTSPAAQAGTYVIEVDDSDNFSFSNSNTTTGAISAFYALLTTSATTNGYGLALESATHNFSTDDTIIVAGTANYNGPYQISVRSATQIEFAVPASNAAETAGTATLAKIIVRADESLVKIVQGENIYIGEADTDNIKKFIGMASGSDLYPFYFVPPNYNTLYSMVNYNSLVTDNVTARLSKLTAMMADKAQDKTIRFLPLDIDSADNNTSGANQVIDFNSFSSGTPTLYLVTPGSAGGLTITVTGTLSLAANQVAYVEVSRNTAGVISGLSGLTVSSITSAPIDENIFVVAFRLNTTDVWLWDGFRVPLGGAIFNGGGTGTLATYFDPVSTTLITGAPVTTDSNVIVNNDTVLYSNLSIGNNQIYRATVVGGNVTAWTPVPAFALGLVPSTSESVRFKAGAEFAQQLAVFNGTTFLVNYTVRYFNGTDYWEQSSIVTSSLLDNAIGTVFSVNYVGSEYMAIDYSVSRATLKEVGTIYMVTDGTNVSVTTSGANLNGQSGVTFSGSISGSLVQLTYTTTSTGNPTTMKYMIRRWSNAPGGPGGVPNYSGGGGGSTAAAGSTGNIQFNNGGLLYANANFNIDPVDLSFNLDGLRQTILSSPIVVADNTSIPTSLFSFSDTYTSAIIEYSLTRNGGVRTGRLLVANDGTNVTVEDDFVETSQTSVILSATLLGSAIDIQFVSAATGHDGSITYSMRKWS